MSRTTMPFAEWLRLRESADAAARSAELVELVRTSLPDAGPLVVHDLGCGTGSMGRWLSGRLPGPQRWVMYDRDIALLTRASEGAPTSAADGAPVTVETRRRDVTRLGPEELADADLVTASALLDMMTTEELERFVATCLGAGCPVLLTLSVTGEVELTPSDPLDGVVTAAFNAHQRRELRGERALGPDAVAAALDGFTARGAAVEVRASPWHLGSTESELMCAWLGGWVGAARAQRPELAGSIAAYERRRLEEAAAGTLTVTVHHRDLLARPATPGSRSDRTA